MTIVIWILPRIATALVVLEFSLSNDLPADPRVRRALAGSALVREASDQARGRTRTDDLLITNQLLCQLSYASEHVVVLYVRCPLSSIPCPFRALGYA
jgi:hypothetical protein